MPAPSIHLALRFHANFVHSYRGDTPDDEGFGQDLRIILRILDVLDGAAARGQHVRATWDIDNLFSLGEILPEHGPDLIERWRQRVADGRDEFHVMSWNNALLSTHTAWEFDQAVGRALTNAESTGVADLFGVGTGDRPAIVRPQEMMFTPRHLDLYPRHGIDAISLYYSAVPFNAFSNFVPPLSLVERFNPLTLTSPGVAGTMTLLPAHNHGDIADQLSLRGWLRRLRRAQLRLEEPHDLLVLIDADADDEFWYGYPLGRLGPLVGRALPMATGLDGLLRSIADLDFVTYTTPGTYLLDHDPVGEVSIAQDTADGSFDGYASWAEKWSNAELWTGIERARLLELHARRLGEEVGGLGPEEAALLARSAEARLRAMSTTNFGLSSPIVIRSRLEAAVATVGDAVRGAAEALASVEARGGENPPGADHVLVRLLDHPRGISTDAVAYTANGSRALLRLPLVGEHRDLEVVVDGRSHRPAVLGWPDRVPEVLLVADVPAGGERRLTLRAGPGATSGAGAGPVIASRHRLANDRIELALDDAGHPAGLAIDGTELGGDRFVRTAVTYDGEERLVDRWLVHELTVLGDGPGAVAVWRGRGRVEVVSGQWLEVDRTFLVAAGIPAVHVETTVRYPDTRSDRYRRARAERLGQRYDGCWEEVMPCELRPSLRGAPGRPLRVWKHNALDHTSSYELPHHRATVNEELDSANNHVTAGWMAVSDGHRGLLVAQATDVTASFAFAPLRTRRTPTGLEVRINPFGAYHGRQWRYPTQRSGLGRWIAEHADTTCQPHAPSFGGRTQRTWLLLAPFAGDAPPERVRRDAEGFAAPPAVIVSQHPGRHLLGPPAHRSWAYGDPAVGGTSTSASAAGAAGWA